MNTDKSALDDVVVLDGREVETFHALCASRWRAWIDSAIEAKTSGKGILARPEVDVGLIELCLHLDTVDPDGDWKRNAYITLIWTIDDALRAGGDWTWAQYDSLLPYVEDPLRELVSMGERPIPENAKNAKKHPLLRALVNTGTKITGEWAAHKLARQEGIDRDLICRVDQQPIIDAFEGHRPEVVRAAMLRVATANRLTYELGGSTKNWKSPEIEPLPDDFPKPLWRNLNVPQIPLKSRAARWEVGWEVHLRSRDVFSAASTVNVYTYALGASAEQAQFDPKNSATDYTDTSQMFNRWLRWPRAMEEFASLELFFDESPTRYLASNLAHARIRCQFNQWDEHFYAFDALTVADKELRSEWVRQYLAMPIDFRSAFFDPVLQLLSGEPLDKERKVPKSDARFYHESFAVQKAIHQDNVTAFNEHLPAMMAAYRRLGNRQFTKELCLAAIALQREALRRGMKIDIPQDWPNHPPTVEAPDPVEPDTHWSPWAGVQLLVDNPTEPLAWPTMLLNRRVRRVVKSEAAI